MRRCPRQGSPYRFLIRFLSALVLIWSAASGRAQNVVTASDFVQQLAAAQQLVTACAGSAGACDPSTLPGRERVQGGAAGDFTANWQWLRDQISGSKAASPTDRAQKMKAAQAHLAELAAETGAGQGSASTQFGRARAAANAVLARSEFRAGVEGPTWTERQLAHLQDWILRLFSGMDKIGRKAPWLAPLIEWGCFALAVAGLLWFVRQSLARQALRIALSEGAALAGNGDRDSADWARLAQERAAAQNWREAMHYLYWASIALMESRRAWRPNATRTPREYVKLLKPGTEAHRALRDLTRSFERVWYGHAQATQAQYSSSLESFRLLETCKPEHAAVSGVATGSAALLPGGA